jgi:hypothetical protein
LVILLVVVLVLVLGFSGRFEDEEEPGIAHFSDRLLCQSTE